MSRRFPISNQKRDRICYLVTVIHYAARHKAPDPVGVGMSIFAAAWFPASDDPHRHMEWAAPQPTCPWDHTAAQLPRRTVR